MIFRWLALAAMLGALGISVYYRHRARRTGDVVARRREGVGLMLAKAIGGLALLLAAPETAWAAMYRVQLSRRKENSSTPSAIACAPLIPSG